jgi:hypothetical protein
MNTAQARVLDPILSAVAKGYEPQQTYIADILFPRVPVNVRGGTIITFGREQFQVVKSVRAPGTDTKQVEVGYGSEKFSLVDNRLIGRLPLQLMQEANAGPSIDEGARTVSIVQQKMDLEREVDAAALARAPGAYANSNKTAVLSGTELWTDPASNPFAVVEAGKEAIRKKIGRRPNFWELPPTVLTALRNHPKVLDKLSTSTDRAPATMAQLQALFEIPNIVEGSAIVDEKGNFLDVWGNDSIMAYVSPKSLQSMGSMNYGYTYQLEGYPVVEQPSWDVSKESWLYPVSDARQVVMACADSGYLIRGPVAP